MYEDRVKGLLDEENYSMLSVKYRTEQQQLDETIKTISARLEETKAETDDAKPARTFLTLPPAANQVLSLESNNLRFTLLKDMRKPKRKRTMQNGGLT